MDPWIWTLIFLGLAVVFAVLEIFIASGGILAFVSIAVLLTSVVFAFMDNIVFGGLYTAGLIIGCPILLWYAFRWWPESTMGRRIMLNPEEDPALQPDAELEARKQLVGKRGVARSKMMLSGQIEIDGKRYGAISDSETVEPGEAVVVVSVDGVNILVRKVDDKEVVAEEKPAEEIDAVEDPFA